MAAHVLVVDDNRDIRETIALLLDDAGYAVTLAQDGREALGVLQASRSACVVLLDVNMPVMDGWAVLRAVRQDNKLSQRLAFVIITAGHRTLPLDVARMLAEWPKPIPFLTKPFNIVDMLAVVGQAEQRLQTRASAHGRRHAEQAGN